MNDHKQKDDMKDARPAPDEEETQIIKPTDLPEEVDDIHQTVRLKQETVVPSYRGEGDNLHLVRINTPRFHIKKRLGMGGAGEVILIEDRDIQRDVALKKLREKNQNPDMVRRFISEIRMVGQLEHPNIVPIHDVGIDDEGQYYFIMKYVEGESIAHIIAKLSRGNREYHRKYTFAFRTQIFLEILQAVDFAHSKRIIHRDIKPANIMVGRFGEVSVMDWGISKILERGVGEDPQPGVEDPSVPEDQRTIETDTGNALETEQGMIVGTPAYMAPEQVHRGRGRIDERTDVYSLSALFYEFLTLESYLGEKTEMPELLRKVLHKKPKFAMMMRNRHQSAVPADLSHFLSRGLAKDPARRYQSVREMINVLQKITEGYTPVQCPFTLSKRITNSMIHLVNNYPMTGLLFFMLVIFLVLGGIFLIVQAF